MRDKFLLFMMLLAVPVTFQSADECRRCDCSVYPQLTDTCTKCCFIQKGVVSSQSTGTVTIVPSPAQKTPTPRTFEVPPHVSITGHLAVGEEATVYYHELDGKNVATRIELTDYIQGQLTPDSLPTPKDNVCSSAEVPTNATRVLFGSSGLIALRYPYVALRVNGADIITIQRTKQGMLISAKLFDAGGHLAAQIVDNHFFVNVKGVFRLEIAPGHHSLKVFDGENTLVDIQFMNPTTLRILGSFFGPLGTHLDVSPKEMKVSGGAHFSGMCLIGGRVGIDVVAAPSGPRN
jgi:hypothetical protein